MKRFFDKIASRPKRGCWVWTASRNSKGYGTFSFDGKTNCAHRFSYLLFKGKIPRGYAIDHTCNNKACVNPDHLDAVDYGENMRRYHARLKGHSSPVPS